MSIKILVTCLMGQGTIEAKLVPLSYSKNVSKIIVLRKKIGPTIGKVEYIKLPFLCKFKFFNVIITPFILSYYARTKKVDLILSYHFIPHAIFAYIASIISNVPFNVSQTGLNIQKYLKINIFRKFILYILNKSCFINVPGLSSRDFWIKNGIAKNKLNLLHSKIDADKYQDLKLEKVYDFIYLGRLSAEKQVDKIIIGIYNLYNNGLNVKLVIVGDGPEMGKLIRLTNKLKLRNNITFTGFISNPEIWLNKSKLFLMCSKTEGLPTALMQAMACKLIAIVSNVGNISDLIKNNKNGFLFKIDNVKFFYKLMEDKYLNYDRLNYIKENARMTIMESYTYKHATEIWDKIIETNFSHEEIFIK